MVIKDIKINMNTTTKERYNWLASLLDESSKDNIYMIGETIYGKDLSLSSISIFTEFIKKYAHLKIYIQDVDTLSFKLLKTEGKSMYTMLKTLENVVLFTTVEEAGLINSDIRDGISFVEKRNEVTNYSTNIIDLDKKYSQVRKEHEEDIIGVFINEVLKSELENNKKAAIVDIGLETLIRR